MKGFRLARFGVAAMMVLGLGYLTWGQAQPPAAPATAPPAAPAPTSDPNAAPASQADVRAFGAKGDGKTDDTAAFKAAFAAVSKHGGVAFVPTGNYLIATHLDVPPNVTLEGVWRIPTVKAQYNGSTLLAIEGAGAETGAAFISLGANSAVKGITIFYPNQTPDKIQAYPWCIAAAGGDCPAVVDCTLVNPYQGIDFGTSSATRHLIRNVYGQPLRRGIYVDKCYDVGRIENVHFQAIWNWDEKTGIQSWMAKNGEAFIFGRTDWQSVSNSFCFGYRIGYHFIATKDGLPSGSFSGIGADATNVAVMIEAGQPAGLLINNGQFVSFVGDKPTHVVTAEAFAGAAQFQNCSFWGAANQSARLAGSGTVTFANCNFVQWTTGAPAIDLSGGNLIVTGSNFQQVFPQLIVQNKAQSAIFTSNRVAGPLNLANPAKVDLQAGLNVEKKAPVPPAK